MEKIKITTSERVEYNEANSIPIISKEEEMHNEGNGQASAHQYTTILWKHSNHTPHQAQDPTFFANAIINDKTGESLEC